MHPIKHRRVLPHSLSHRTMQRPTHPCLHLRDANDAHAIFEAVSLGYLPKITRRLNEAERASLVRSGAVFVWSEGESEDGSNLVRWTDGRSWGQSRMREPYLFYDEKVFDNNNATRGPAYRFIDGGPRSGPSSSAISHQDRTAYHHPGLVKQAYSAWVYTQHSVQKWHITAYFSHADLQRLPFINNDPILREIYVPDGKYVSSHSRTRDGPGPSHAHARVMHVGDTNTHPNPRVLHHHGELHGNLPPIASLAARHPMPYIPPPAPVRHPHPLPHVPRLPEDQRMIHMLNRHVQIGPQRARSPPKKL